jgi:hypothetical protein
VYYIILIVLKIHVRYFFFFFYFYFFIFDNEFPNFLRLTSQLFQYSILLIFLFDLYSCPKSVIKLNKVQPFFFFPELLLIEVQTTTTKTVISDL